MPAPIQNEIAQSILAKEKRRADARAVLNRPHSAVPTSLVTLFSVALGVYLLSSQKFEAPMWLEILLVGCASCTVTNMVELWTTRRRLEAAIVLLQEQNSDR